MIGTVEVLEIGFSHKIFGENLNMLAASRNRLPADCKGKSGYLRKEGGTIPMGEKENQQPRYKNQNDWCGQDMP